jgi:uncharacterized membrane protein
MTSLNDLGVFDQLAWGTLHGQWFHNTANPFNSPMNWLGFHYNPILLMFVPLYAVVASATWYVLVQSLALSVAGWPIFLLASRVCESEKLGFFWTLTYLLNPFLLNAAAWDFHPITLAVPLIATGMLAVEREDGRFLVFSCLPLLFIQEHLGITVAAFGLLWWLRNKTWKLPIFLISTGLSSTIFILQFAMPWFSPSKAPLMLTTGLGPLSRYSWLGTSLWEVTKTLLFHPLFVIEKVMLEMGGLGYLASLLFFFLGAPLAAPEFLLPGTADVLANIMSLNMMPRSLFAYHSVTLVPVLVVAAIHGANRIPKCIKKISATELSHLVLVASLIGGYLAAPYPLPFARNFWRPVHILNTPDPTVEKICSLIGPTASVSAQANVAAHFSQRPEIYQFPNKVGDVDVIILRLESPTTNVNDLSHTSINQRRHDISTLDFHLQMERQEYIHLLETLLSEGEYGISLWSDPWLLLSRGVAITAPSQDIYRKIHQLKQDWNTKEP